MLFFTKQKKKQNTKAKTQVRLVKICCVTLNNFIDLLFGSKGCECMRVKVTQQRGQGVNWDRADKVVKRRAEQLQARRLLCHLKRGISAFTQGFLRTGGSQQRE